MVNFASVKVGKNVFTAWEEVSVAKSIESAVGSFAIKSTQPFRNPINPGDRVEIELNNKPVISGYIDRDRAKTTPKGRTYQFSGRDRASDLVDCSAMNDSGQFLGLTIGAIAKALAKPLGVEIIPPADEGAPFETFDIQPGETAWEAIERACRMRQFLAFSNEFGALVIARPGSARVPRSIVEGSALEIESDRDLSNRFSEYVIRGQSPSSNDWNGDNAAAPEGVVTDPGVRRYRPLIVLAEQSTDSFVAANRAAWEATVRAARGSRVKVKMQGWEELGQGRGGDIWRPNRIVRVIAASVGVNADLLIAGVLYSLGPAGTTATLDLVRPDAFTPEPIVAPDEPVGPGWEDNNG